MLVLVSSFPGFLDAAVDGDSEQPSAESRSSVESVQMPENEGENFLNGIGSFVGIEEDSSGDRVNLVVVPRIDHFEGVFVPGEESFNQNKVLIESRKSRFIDRRWGHRCFFDAV